jgi:hypothetical protein
MMKKLLLATAASGLMLSAALAQSPTPPAANQPSPPAASKPSTPAPAAKQDMSKPADASKSSAATPASPSASASADQKVVTSQTPDQLLASKFKGTDVVGADDKKIGDVSDILFDKDGKILAYVVSIGGFLGIGSKDVAMAPTAFQLVKGTDGNADKLKVAMSQDQLKNMASFEAYKPPRPTTTGSAPGAGGMGSRGGMGTK